MLDACGHALLGPSYKLYMAYDVIIIGGGHNGLTCAAYLGMAGLKVKVLERRALVGGAAVSQEFHPGFRNSVAAYTVSLLNPKVIADLRLQDHGLKIVERRAQNFVPSPDGHYLLAADGQTERHIAKFSTRDAERYGAFAPAITAHDTFRMRSPRPIPEAPVRTVSRMTPCSSAPRNASSFAPVPVSSMV